MAQSQSNREELTPMQSITLTPEQVEALSSTLRFSCSRLSRIAGAAKHSEDKRRWAAEMVEHLTAVLDELDGQEAA